MASHGCGSHHLQDRSPAVHRLDPTCCRTCHQLHTAPAPCRKQGCPPPVVVYTAARGRMRREAVRGLIFWPVSTTTMVPKDPGPTQLRSFWDPPPRLSGASDFPGPRPYSVDSHASEAGYQSLHPHLKPRPPGSRPRPPGPPPRPHLELCDGEAPAVPLLRAEAVEGAADENRHRGR